MSTATRRVINEKAPGAGNGDQCGDVDGAEFDRPEAAASGLITQIGIFVSCPYKHTLDHLFPPDP
jgi:hypothetical protein